MLRLLSLAGNRVCATWCDELCERFGNSVAALNRWAADLLRESVYAIRLGDNHRSPNGLPLPIFLNKYKEVAARVLEALASHFVIDIDIVRSQSYAIPSNSTPEWRRVQGNQSNNDGWARA